MEVVSNGVVLFLTVSVLLPKIIQKSTPKLPKSSPKPSRIHPKTFQNPPKNAPKTRSGGDCASDRFWAFFFSRICGRLGPSRAPLGTILEPSWGVWRRLGAVLARPRGGLGPSLGRLGASWRILGASWERLGASWKRFGTISTKKFDFLFDFCSQLRCPKPKNSLIFHWFYKHF